AEADPDGGRAAVRRVLFVDDHRQVRSMVRDILEDEDYEVLLAADGPEAIELYARRGADVDLVILDMVMPNMGGAEVFARLRALDPEVKVLLPAGYSRDAEARRLLRSGVVGFLQKPYQVEQLIRAVRDAIAAPAPTRP